MKNFLQTIIKILRVILNKTIHVKPDRIVSKERFGSEYGGWVIATDLINKDSVVYSFGVGSDISFDLALIKKYGLTIHAFDPTPESIKWVKGQSVPGHFKFHEYGIADFDGEATFNPPENPDYISHTILDRPQTNDQSIRVPFKRLSTIMKELGHDRIDVLKMDIEGAEYAVIDDVEKSNIYPKQILVELHHRFPNVGIQKSKTLIARLRKRGYCLFSVSDDNDELSFIY